MSSNSKPDVKTAIQRAYNKTKSKDPVTLAMYADGLSPTQIAPYLSQLDESDTSISSPLDSNYKNFFYKLPASNPEYFQWWFTLETLEVVAERIHDQVSSKSIKCLCIGVPTVAAYLGSCGVDVTLLDIDDDIISEFKELYASKCSGIKYDVQSSLYDRLRNHYDIVIIDPPWYPNYYQEFFNRAIDALKEGGLIFAPLGQVNTRENMSKQRHDLIQKMYQSGHELVSIESSSLKYSIPLFEEEVLRNESEKLGEEGNKMEIKPWRSADLALFKINGNNLITLEDDGEVSFSQGHISIHSVKRSRTSIRFFSKDVGTFESEPTVCTPIDEYSNTFSKKDKVRKFNVWNSNKEAFAVQDFSLVTRLLKAWEEEISFESFISELEQSQPNLVSKARYIEKTMKLWERYWGGDARRDEDKIIEKTKSVVEPRFASDSEKAKREHKSNGDGFRTKFQRDRDRIIWSSGFRKLADKTQLFPLNEDHHLRQRLAHSIEVSQLASTIASSFGLDQNLVEAGALAHDIGHTPFGHAGEFALDVLLKKHFKISCGFNHYEHGVDVVRYLEGAYQHKGHYPHFGLNLTNEVCDCILKHTFCHSGKKHNINSIYGMSKHQDIITEGFSHLEGQAVRAADKISYLLSDIEDGILLNVISLPELLSCRLFHRGFIDLRLQPGESLYFKFVEQRGNLIKLLMEDIILESSKRLSRLKTKESVFNFDKYAIDHSPLIKRDMDEVWEKIQVAKLHKDPRVLAANMNAAKKVSDLTLLFIAIPGLIDESFRIEHERLQSLSSAYIKFYDKYGIEKVVNNEKVRFITDVQTKIFDFLPMDRLIGEENIKIDFSIAAQDIRLYNIILAKDYVASLTDNRVNRLYLKLLHEA